MTPSHRSLLLAAFLTLAQLLLAIDLSKDLGTTGPLGIKLDYGLATTTLTGDPKRWDNTPEWRPAILYSSHLSFQKDLDAVTDGQLVQLAYDAHLNMIDNFRQYKPKQWNKDSIPKKTPFVMTILAFGNQIILSSSQKGNVAYINNTGRQSRVKDDLDLCQALFNRDMENPPDHVNGRSCGEIFAMHQFYLSNGQRSITDFSNPRIVSVQRNAMSLAPSIKNPCTNKGDENDWGCDWFLSQQNSDVKVISSDTAPEPYDLGTMGGGTPTISQLSVECGS